MKDYNLARKMSEISEFNIQDFVVNIVTESIPIMTRISAVDKLCLNLSLKKIKNRRLQEGTEPDVQDLLHTTGYWVVECDEWYQEDRIHGNRPYRGVGVVPGYYKGYGAYQSINAVQEFSSILSLCKYLQKQNIETVLEIGSKRGGSLYLWTRALLPDLAISIDINYVANRKNFFEQFSEINTICIEGNSTSNVTQNKVQELLDKFDQAGLDFVYIDGNHDYKQVKNDFENYLNFVDGKGFIALHDIDDYSTGVPRLWSEIQKKYKTVVFGEKSPKNGLVIIEN